MSPRVLALLTAALVAFGAAPALASTASLQGGVLEITGTAEDDDLNVLQYTQNGQQAVAVTDRYRPVEASGGCTQDFGGSIATCPVSAITLVRWRLGDGRDTIVSNVSLPVQGFGEGGDDSQTIEPPPASRRPVGAVLDGGDGDDHLQGSDVDDELHGGAGADAMNGGPGNDLLDPGSGPDIVSDRGGDDRVTAIDGEFDRVDCGPGADTGDFDDLDSVKGCEAGRLPPTAAPTQCIPEIDAPSSLSRRTLKRKRLLKIAATAPAGCTISASLRDSGGGPRLAKTAAAGTAGVLQLQLSRKAARRAVKAKKLKLTLVASASGVQPQTRTFRIKLRR